MEKGKIQLIFVIFTVLMVVLGGVFVYLGFSDGNVIFQALSYVLFALAVIFLILTWRMSIEDEVSDKRSDAIRVVAIDDEADILRLIRIKLSKEGFEVSTAADGEEGISKVLKEKPDVMVVDVMMPGKDGYQVVSEVKKKMGVDAPVTIMLTSKAEEGDMVKGLSVGADDYITKPFSPSELIERINVALIKGAKDKV